MNAVAIAFLITLSLITATVSGVFGMAGGLMLMGGLAWLLPINAAFVTHGLLQAASNGWRAIIHRQHISWRIVGMVGLGSLAAGGLMSLIAFTPSKPLVFMLMGLVPIFVWLPANWTRLDASKTPHALICGFFVTATNLLAGVAGPLLDIFFVHTTLTRHQIVATKAATQVLSHVAKIVIYGAPLFAAKTTGLPPAWVFAVCIVLSFLGAMFGGQILDRLSDVNFKRVTLWVVTALGALYFVEGIQLLLASPSAG